MVSRFSRFVRNQIIFANTMFKAVCYHPDECQIITVGTDRKVGFSKRRIFDESFIEFNRHALESFIVRKLFYLIALVMTQYSG